jgi:very-short-patch-repair endonuclease
MSIDRMGDKNPIHKVIQDEEKYDAWRRELSKSLKGNLKGVNLVDKVGEEGALITRAKMSSSARSREVHGHKGCQHTDETKEILRRKTAQHISSSERKVSNVQRRLYEELKNKLGDEVLLEHQFHFYSIDIVYRDIAIEVDGDFWHANEAKGFTVKHNVQIKNKVNDINKDKYLAKNGWRVIRVWESDINDDIENVVKEIEDAARS